MRGFHTDEQLTDAQVEEFAAAGCHEIHCESGSGSSRARPVLTELLARIGAGDIWSLSAWTDWRDRQSPACGYRNPRGERRLFPLSSGSYRHGNAPGHVFPSSAWRCGTAGKSSDRRAHEAGMKAAQGRGRTARNPGLRKRSLPLSVLSRRHDTRPISIASSLPRNIWLPVVRRMRPFHRWDDVAEVSNYAANPGQRNG